jgi:hypothetical protein
MRVENVSVRENSSTLIRQKLGTDARLIDNFLSNYLILLARHCE